MASTNHNTYNKIGIDHKIGLIQDVLFKNLNLLDVDFYGRVERVFSKDLRGNVAEVYVNGKERKEVYYNDAKAKGGNVFFIASENSPAVNNNPVEFQNEVRIVFMLNLKHLYPNESLRMDSEIQAKVSNLLNRTGYAEITGITTGIESVMNGFSIDYIRKLNQQPFHIFSVNITIKYNFNSKNC